MNDSLVGFRFRPTDEEIIFYFLDMKMSGHEFPFPAVKEVDIRNYNPWNLPEQSLLPDDEVWYFFSAPSKISANSTRTARTTSEGTGSWNITGRDREIKNKRTGEVIGLKKTLVFFKGRNRDKIRTRWVMNEFHSNNAASYQKEYVFCRLKFKFDDKSATSQYEASPSWPFNRGNHDAQTIFSPVNRELPIELDMLDSSDELDFSLLHSFLQPEQGSSPSNGSNNECNVWSTQLDMSEQDDDFVNSLLSDDVQLYEETIHTRPHGCNPTQPLSGMYVGDNSDSDSETFQARAYIGDNSDTDTETLQAQFGDAGFKEYRQMQKVRAPTESPPSSNLRRYKKGEHGLSHYETLVSTANAEAEMKTRINLVHSSTPANIRACKVQPQPKFHNMVEKECAPKVLQLHGEGSRKVYRDRDIKEAAMNLPQKGNPTVKLHKDQKMPETTKAKTNLKSISTKSDGSNRKGSFIFMETSPLNHEQIPPSIYIRNVAVGVVLSVICIWEMVSLH